MAKKYKSYKRAKKASKSSGGTALAMLMLLSAVLIGGGYAYLYYKGASKELLNEATLCPESGPKGHLAVLVDMTDPASMTQMRFARTEIERQIESVGVGTMISIGIVTPDDAQRESALLMVCKPPSGDEADALTENRKMIETTYQERFLKPLDALLTQIMTISEAPSSPIMENLQELLSRIPDFGAVENQRIVIFSNLSQHSDVLSFYRGEDWDSFDARGGTSMLARNLSRTDVILLRLPPPAKQVMILEDFWVEYFDAQGARSVNPISVGEY